MNCLRCGRTPYDLFDKQSAKIEPLMYWSTTGRKAMRP